MLSDYKIIHLKKHDLKINRILGAWYSSNCGMVKGIICKRDMDSIEPIPVPTEETVEGYCPDTYFGTSK